MQVGKEDEDGEGDGRVGLLGINVKIYKDFAILRWALPFFQPTFNLYVAVDDSAVYKPPPDFEKEEKEREAKKRKKKAAPKKK